MHEYDNFFSRLGISGIRKIKDFLIFVALFKKRLLNFKRTYELAAHSGLDYQKEIKKSREFNFSLDF